MLGWLNATVELTGTPTFERSLLARQLMAALVQGLNRQGAEVAHLKFILATDRQLLWANLTANDGETSYGGAEIGRVERAMLKLNARVGIGPGAPRGLAMQVIQEAAGGMEEPGFDGWA